MAIILLRVAWSMVSHITLQLLRIKNMRYGIREKDGLLDTALHVDKERDFLPGTWLRHVKIVQPVEFTAGITWMLLEIGKRRMKDSVFSAKIRMYMPCIRFYQL